MPDGRRRVTQSARKCQRRRRGQSPCILAASRAHAATQTLGEPNNGAAGHDTPVWIVVSVSLGSAITFRSVALLFGLTLTGRFPSRRAPRVRAGRATSDVRAALGTRAAVACFIAGIRLLTFADAAWAHAIGVLCLFGFIVAALLAIVPSALADQAANVPADASGSFLPDSISASRRPGSGGSR